MSDIVNILRSGVPCISDIGCSQELCNEAADEIDRLLAKNAQNLIDLNEYRLDVERLRAALQAVMNDLEIVVECGGLNDGFLNDIVYTNARAALEGKHD